MSADPKVLLTDLLKAALKSVAPDHVDTPILLERPKQASHGDFATNLALQLAKPLKRNPRELAAMLLAELPASKLIAGSEVAGAGFINFTLAADAKTAVVADVLARGADFGRGAAKGVKVQVEFVSANPTGPLHVGHGRGAAYGASLSDVLAFAGFEVTREYYVNDAGRQMDILALSTWLRYLAAFGIEIAFPPNAYQGDYVVGMGHDMRDAHQDRFARVTAEQVLAGTPGLPPAERNDDEAKQQREEHLDALIANAKRLLGDDYAWVHGFALNEQLGDGRDDLGEFGVHFDKWFSEQSLFDTGLVERAVAQLEKQGHIYLQDGAKWFRSTAFGDEKDRVVQRENGLYTYFASDIAYHLNKYERGFDRIIDIWGADHHGYIPRVKGAIAALGLPPEKLEVALVQFAVLYRNGQKTSMSTRSGEFVTLRELRHEVGNDACRFFYVLRKSDQHLDFDLDLAKSQSNENPVYYVQYAHARVCSVLNQWGGEASELAGADFGLLQHERELALCARLSAFPELVQNAAADHAPHQVAFYLKDLAADFHGWYNAERMLVEDEALKLARLALAGAVRQVLASGLALLGVSAPESM
ncbi:arginine--tRNA ligase [Thauera linaloolentis]|uniref:Arginine--tRNA ligase n=1 Tax=Thauera linaloolentis (strain DSM 12138 / JCM 21573 / CCUG 41526 / CIP 105981 / IAM 15112 / NBRC 102519 / 47Lol) TaxID=1123367 RepID=N6Z1G4_THAL4|nr:arginine--tRNA ligase [Thauera linaloolentis]ENO88253.1 arginyl-tRNA ligase [Thauera linaloolentis 47Lol = DSM 12138]MCM8566830.1 arginine--tRNA ligase [Thauera linaloolentis]